MFTQNDVSLVAQSTKSHLAHKAILAISEKHTLESLSSNDSFNEEIWEGLFNAGPILKSTDTKNTYYASLLSSAKQKNQVNRFLKSCDYKTRVCALYLGIGVLDDEILAELISAPYFDLNHIAALLASDTTLPPKVTKDLWSRLHALIVKSRKMQLGTITNIEKIISSNLPTDKEVVSLIYQISRHSDFSDGIVAAMDYRPGVVSLLLELPNSKNFYHMASNSRHLPNQSAEMILNYYKERSVAGFETDNRYLIANITANPWIDPKIRDEAFSIYKEEENLPEEWYSWYPASDRQNSLTWYDIERNIKDALVNKKPELDNATNLLSLTKGELENMYGVVESAGGWESYPELKDKFVQAHNSMHFPSVGKEYYPLGDLVSDYLDTLGVDGWKLFLSLLPGWHQSLDDLTELVKSTIDL